MRSGVQVNGDDDQPRLRENAAAVSAEPAPGRWRFQPHQGARIATDSVRLVYMANPRVDLTARVAPYVKEDGIAIPDAEMPAGNYQLLLQVKDSEGRAGIEYLNLKVSAK